jgi:hypothetical protein
MSHDTYLGRQALPSLHGTCCNTVFFIIMSVTECPHHISLDSSLLPLSIHMWRKKGTITQEAARVDLEGGLSELTAMLFLGVLWSHSPAVSILITLQSILHIGLW